MCRQGVVPCWETHQQERREGIPVEILAVAGAAVFGIAMLMTMVGKGGGNFYVILLSFLLPLPMYHVASTAQFILFAASTASFVVFQQKRNVLWPLAILVGSLMAVSAFTGGFLSRWLAPQLLELLLAVMIAVAGVAMLVPAAESPGMGVGRGVGSLRLQSLAGNCTVNLWVVVPLTVCIGLGSGMVGVAGGTFLVPLMVLACRVPMRLAVGTVAPLLAVTAFSGFLGHAFQGDAALGWGVPLAFCAVAGGLVGSRFALSSRPRHLKLIFAATNFLAAALVLGRLCASVHVN